MITQEEFLKLTIGQEVYLEGIPSTIITKIEKEEGCLLVVDVACGNRCSRYIKDFSLTPPKTKKKYYIWSVKNPHWFKSNHYMDNKGSDTKGYFYSEQWSNIDKIRHDNEFIEV